MFFSKNVNTQTANHIRSRLGFQKTDNLGKYLGVPLLHGRIVKDTYSYLLDKVRRKLSGWAANSLSLAGRITLAKAVLSAIPYYTMQSTRLILISLTNELCRNVKAFI